MASLPAVRACIFDMDGLLINTEDLYKEASDAILANHGLPPVTWALKAKLQGLPAFEARTIFLAETGLGKQISMAQLMEEEAPIMRALFATSVPLPGAEALLSKLEKEGIPFALASSATSITFALKTSHLKPLFAHFKPGLLVLTDDPRMAGRAGKPAPFIYQTALEAINATLPVGERKILPAEALVFEDAIPGVEAGRRAGMRVVWVPHVGLWEEISKTPGREGRVLAGIEGEYRQEGMDCTGPAGGGKTGHIGDGWAIRKDTLESLNLGEWGL